MVTVLQQLNDKDHSKKDWTVQRSVVNAW
jgi:hypothetical protein